MKESELVRTVRDYLQLLENQGKIDWYERLNSGEVLAKQAAAVYKVKLCRPGTPDFIVLHYGLPIFFECKKKGGKLSEEQLAFADKMYKQGIPCYKVDKIEDVIEVFK